MIKTEQIFTSESITEGHPDKLCDLISDSILDACLTMDQNSRVAIETLAAKNTIIVAGQLTTLADINIDKIVRTTLKEIGYDNELTDIDYRTCKIEKHITKQSSDIALSVDSGGAGDQGIMFGYATDETNTFMPFPIYYAHKLAKRLTFVRKEGILNYLRPDGKTQVSVEYVNNIPVRIVSILISTQHLENISIEVLKEDLIKHVVLPTIDSKFLDENTIININPTGRFVIGGPLGDTGLTGRKIIVDTYGGFSRHGGGAFSGKDASKVDRSAAYMARHIAKNIIANNLATRCEIQLSYSIGMIEPTSVFIETFNTNKIPNNEILSKILNAFNLTPNGIIDYLDLKKPIYTQTTNYGHFGKNYLPWEKIIQL